MRDDRRIWTTAWKLRIALTDIVHSSVRARSGIHGNTAVAAANVATAEQGRFGILRTANRPFLISGHDPLDRIPGWFINQPGNRPFRKLDRLFRIKVLRLRSSLADSPSIRLPLVGWIVSHARNNRGVPARVGSHWGRNAFIGQCCRYCSQRHATGQRVEDASDHWCGQWILNQPPLDELALVISLLMPLISVQWLPSREEFSVANPRDSASYRPLTDFLDFNGCGEHLRTSHKSANRGLLEILSGKRHRDSGPIELLIEDVDMRVLRTQSVDAIADNDFECMLACRHAQLCHQWSLVQKISLVCLSIDMGFEHLPSLGRTELATSRFLGFETCPFSFLLDTRDSNIDRSALGFRFGPLRCSHQSSLSLTRRLSVTRCDASND